ASADIRVTAVSGLRRATSRKPVKTRIDTPTRISPTGQSPAAKSTAATANPATVRTKSTIGGVTPNQRGCVAVYETGTGPVSLGGTSSRTVVPVPESTGRPQPGQKRAVAGSGAPHSVQVGATSDAR